MAEIHKKVWPEYFQQILIGKKKIELKLADFNLNEGDILVLEEYDPKTKTYSGRSIKKKVIYLAKFKLEEFNNIQDIEKYGLYEIGLE